MRKVKESLQRHCFRIHLPDCEYVVDKLCLKTSDTLNNLKLRCVMGILRKLRKLQRLPIVTLIVDLSLVITT